MAVSISGTVSAQPADIPAAAPAATRQAPQPQQQQSVDIVALSQSAQVSQLSLQGQSPLQIAEALGIPVSTVDTDLGVGTTAVT
jgi:DNA-directed RNA polymerase specialized sigma24 family protein